MAIHFYPPKKINEIILNIISKIILCLIITFADPSMTKFLTPSPYHLLDHEYGMTPQNQIIPNPLTSPLTKAQVSSIYFYKYSKISNILNIVKFLIKKKNYIQWSLTVP